MTAKDTIEEVFSDRDRNEGCIYRKVIDETERALIERALEYSHGKQLLASELLGLNRNTLRTKIKKLSIRVDKFKN